MSLYSDLKAFVKTKAYTNGNNEITGQMVQDALVSMITSLGTGYQYMGVATTSTNPGTPDQKVFYLASEVGTYSNFGSPALTVSTGEVAIFYYDTAWHKAVTGAASKADVDALIQTLEGEVSELGQKVDDLGLKVNPMFDALVPSAQYTTTFKEGITGAVKLSGMGFYGGKNLVDFADIAETTLNGVTYSVSNGEIHLNGTASANVDIPLTPSQTIIIPNSSSLNTKAIISGSFTSNFSLYLMYNNTSHIVANCIIYASSAQSGVSDVQVTSSASETNANTLMFRVSSGCVCTNTVLKPMVTFSARYGAGEYEVGGTAIPFSGDVYLPSASNICVQGASAISVDVYDFDVLSEIAKLPDNVSALLEDKGVLSASGTGICRIPDGLIGSTMKSCTIAGVQSGTIKAIGRNLFDRDSIVATGSQTLHFTRVYLRPNTTYIYADNYGEWRTKGYYLQVYSNSVDNTGSATRVAYLVSNDIADADYRIFTTGNDTYYWLRYYTSDASGILSRASEIMLEEGDSINGYVAYKEAVYDLAEELPAVLDSPCYLIASGAITCTYYASVGVDDTSLPGYWKDYMLGKVTELKNLMTTTSMHSLIFQFITDVHIPSNEGYSHLLVKYIQENAGITPVVFGGDIIDYANNDAELALHLFYDFRERFDVGAGRVMCLNGNHDTYHPLGDSAFYNILVRPLNDRINTNGANTISRVYYYIDDESQKVRIINFDSSDWSLQEFVPQFEWLVDTLNSIPSGWGCVLFSHIVIDGIVPANDIRAIVKAFIDRTAGTLTLYNGDDVSYDFTGATGEMICIIGGHSHKDWSDTAVGCPCIVTTCDAIDAAIADSPTMTRGTITEQAFDVFFIDIDARTITAKRIGAGSDRNWTF